MSSNTSVFCPGPHRLPTPIEFRSNSPNSVFGLKDLWRALNDAWNQALTFPGLAAKLQDHFYRVGDRVLHLAFANDSLVPLLTPALAHLEIAAPKTVDLRVKLWDRKSTGVFLPPLPATMYQPLPADAQWGSYAHCDRFQAFLQPRYPLFTMFDRQHNEAIYWVEDSDRLPLSEGGAPLLTLLHWWLGRQNSSSHGYQVIHGAAVGTARGGALLVGRSGSGKSTTALACFHGGLSYLGDDYCLVARDPCPQVYSLYSSGKVHLSDLTRFSRLQIAQSANRYAEADKAVYFFADAFADQIVPSLPLKAIVLPTIRGEGPSRLQAISPATALLAMAPSTVFQLVGERGQTLGHLGQLVRQLPCYRLDLGSEIEQVPPLIANLLAQL